MSDETTTEKPVTETAFPQARKGQDDDGQVVTSAGGEPMWGAIADITDNEPGRKKK